MPFGLERKQTKKGRVILVILVGEKDTQLGIITLLIASFFLMSGLEMLDIQIFEPELCTVLSFVLVAIGVYLIVKK